MQILKKIPGMTQEELATLEANANAVLQKKTSSHVSEARLVLEAIASERMKRKERERVLKDAAIADIHHRVKDLNLFERTVLAFDEIPPEDWEVEVLDVISRNPDRDFDVLAELIGKAAGSYINLAVGTLCSTRDHYLRATPKVLGEKEVYSALIIDFVPHLRSDGSRWHGWNLKPEVEAALRHLRIL